MTNVFTPITFKFTFNPFCLFPTPSRNLTFCLAASNSTAVFPSSAAVTLPSSIEVFIGIPISVSFFPLFTGSSGKHVSHRGTCRKGGSLPAAAKLLHVSLCAFSFPSRGIGFAKGISSADPTNSFNSLSVPERSGCPAGSEPPGKPVAALRFSIARTRSRILDSVRRCAPATDAAAQPRAWRYRAAMSDSARRAKGSAAEYPTERHICATATLETAASKAEGERAVGEGCGRCSVLNFRRRGVAIHRRWRNSTEPKTSRTLAESKKEQGFRRRDARRTGFTGFVHNFRLHREEDLSEGLNNRIIRAFSCLFD